jgi:hypothetical protein
MTNDQIKRFIELNPQSGLKLHEVKNAQDDNCTCGEYFAWGWQLQKHIEDSNPTFSDAKSILEVMMSREDYGDFVKLIGSDRVNKTVFIEREYQFLQVQIYGIFVIDIELVLHPDQLFDLALQWCEEHSEK